MNGTLSHVLYPNGYGGYRIERADVVNHSSPVNTSSIVRPSGKVLLHDASARTMNGNIRMVTDIPYSNSPGSNLQGGNTCWQGGSNPDRGNPAYYTPSYYMTNMGFHHGDRTNVIFCDGHGELRKADILNDPTDSRWALKW